MMVCLNLQLKIHPILNNRYVQIIPCTYPTDTAHKFKQAFTLVSKCTIEKACYSSQLLGKSRLKRVAPPLLPKNDKNRLTSCLRVNS